MEVIVSDKFLRVYLCGWCYLCREGVVFFFMYVCLSCVCFRVCIRICVYD